MKRDAGLERMRQEHVKMFLMGSAISIAFFVTIVLTARGYMGWTTFAMIGVILFIGTLYPFNSWIQLEKKLRIRYTRDFQIPFIKERTQHLSPKFLDLDD